MVLICVGGNGGYFIKNRVRRKRQCFMQIFTESLIECFRVILAGIPSGPAILFGVNSSRLMSDF